MHRLGLQREVDEKDANRLSSLVSPPPAPTNQHHHQAPTCYSTTSSALRLSFPWQPLAVLCCQLTPSLSSLLPPRLPSFSSSYIASPVMQPHVCISLFTLVSPVANPPSFADAPVMCCPFESFTQHALLHLPSPLTFFFI